MADIKLKNKNVEIGVNLHGAELKNLKRVSDGTEYLWCADPAYWNRTSPVLFPFVGMVKDGIYRHEGKEYKVGQHGFARDREFVVVSREDDCIWFALEEDEQSLSIYPFPFRLEIGYQLLENGVKVMWRVKNTGESKMYFSIGAHPAFFCPIREEDKQTDCAFLLQDKNGNLLQEFDNTIFGQGGCVTPEHEVVKLSDGRMPITADLFDHDAKVIENSQVQRVAILDGEGKEYLAVEFDSPLVGIWSPPKKQAPFVCIEPWYGRCDQDDFDGELKERVWGNELEPAEVFEAEYSILLT